MINYINFDVENFDISEDETDSQFSIAKIQAFSSAENRHEMVCSEDVLKNTAETIYNKPILYTINKPFDDFYTHVDPDNTLIAGFIEPNSAEFVRLDDTRLSLNVIGRIWKRYASKFMDILRRDGGKKVSVEMELKDSEKRPDSLIEMKDFSYLGVCLLGTSVQEASPGANLQVLSFAKENEEFQKAYDAEFGMNYSIPDEVKNTVNEGLKLYKEFSVGGTSVALSLGKFLINSNDINDDRLNYLINYFSTQKKQKYNSPPSSDYIDWCLHGGNEGFVWVNKLNKQIENYKFGEVITMPYKKISEINPALKGIDPPISLSQANAIAKQADAIGSDEKKNGWAIAISNFKKTHIVENNKWVKKEKPENKENKEMAMTEEEKKEMAVDTPKDEEKETPQTEKEETPEEEKKEKEEGVEKPQEEKMSLDAYLDVKAMLAMLQDETDDYKMIADEVEKPESERNYAMMCGKMFAKMCKMQASCKDMETMCGTYMAEVEQLRKFKQDVEAKDFQMQVATTLSEVSNCVPMEEMAALQEKAKEFSIDNIDAWKNLVKARAFSFAIKEDAKEPKEKKYGLPFADTTTKSASIWTR